MDGRLISAVIVAAVLFEGLPSAIVASSNLYQQSYQATDPDKLGKLTPGSPEEKGAIRKFEDFLSIISEDNVRNNLRKVYAPNAYFNDTLKELQGVVAIESYLIGTAKNVDSCTVKFLDVASHEGEYYFRWEMRILFKKLRKGEEQVSTGMTHIRFNKEGQVIFHQDYWDAAANFFEKIPILGWMIWKLKSGL